MSKKRMIGIKVSDDSNLPERFRIFATRRGLDYAELLDEWVTAGELALNGNQMELPFSTADKPKYEQLNQINHAEGMAKLEARQAELETSIAKALEKIALKEKEIDELMKKPEIAEFYAELNAGVYDNVLEKDSEPAAPVKPEAPNKPQQSAEVNAKILELHKQGLSLRKIAKQLVEEGIVNSTGKEWNHNIVSRVLKNIVKP